MSDILKYWPLAVVAAGAIASGAVDTFRLTAHADELVDLSESVDENEEDIELIQRTLIQRQGEVKLDLLRIQSDLNKTLEQQDQILRLLQDPDRR